MPKKQFDTGKAPFIEIAQVMGDLEVRAGSEPQALVKGECDVVETKAGLNLSSIGDVKLIIPEGSTIVASTIHGDAAVKGIAGNVTIGDVMGDAVFAELSNAEIRAIHGDLVARGLSGALRLGNVYGDMAAKRVGSVVAEVIHGDLAARRLAGDLTVGDAHGDVSINSADGVISINMVGRDVNLNGVTGPVSLQQVHGDVRLVGPLGPGKHTVVAQGDVVINWPAGEPVEIVATAPKIVTRLSLLDSAAAADTLTGRIGEGGPVLTLTAEGRIVLKETVMVDEKWSGFAGEPDDSNDFTGGGGFGFGVDPETIGRRIRQQVEESLRTVGQDLNGLLGPEFSRRIAEQVSQKAEKAAMKAEKVQRRMDRKGYGAGFAAAQPPQPSAPSVDTSAEQLKILKMVEDGKITPDEANMLLDALGS